MGRYCLRSFIDPGLTTLWLPFRSAFWRKHTSTPQIFYRPCRLQSPIKVAIANSTSYSADLEVSVSLLIQIDKLVQLLESPVFTCACLSCVSMQTVNAD